MKCLHPYFDKKNGREFNCGRCHACRVNITSQWTLRCMFEFDKWKKKGASFLTLTYDDEHLPKDLGLHKEDLQKFFKRLRINLVREYGTHFDEEKQKEVPNVEILYRACGEYGETETVYFTKDSPVPLGRPHYHAVVFGLDDLNDKHREILVKSWPLSDPYMFDKRKPNGNGMEPLCREDIAYVCGYVQKKLNGKIGEETYGKRLPPFSLSSQKLGLDFALQNKDKISRLGYVSLNGHKLAIPRYFREKLQINQSDLIKLDVIKDNDVVYAAFEKHLASIGLSWLLDDPIKNVNAIERRWLSWYEKHDDEWCRLIEDQYQQRRMIYGKAKL